MLYAVSYNDTMEDRLKTNSVIQVIERAADILAQFTLEEPVLGITELSNRTALNKGTVYRILLTLETIGYVRRDYAANKYRLGLELFRLGSLVQSGMDFRREALPIMRQLYQQCGETVNLNVVYDNQRVCVECIESAQSVRIYAKIGMMAPITRGASGKILLAYLPESQISMIVNPLPDTEIKKLLADLHKIREQGYALSWHERAIGAFAVSAPIFSHSGSLVAGLTISGPAERFSDAVVEKNISLITCAAKDISNMLGA